MSVNHASGHLSNLASPPTAAYQAHETNRLVTSGSEYNQWSVDDRMVRNELAHRSIAVTTIQLPPCLEANDAIPRSEAVRNPPQIVQQRSLKEARHLLCYLTWSVTVADVIAV